MTALTFATHARSAPVPGTTPHLHGIAATVYTCHMAVMHWAFMDLGDTQAQATGRVSAINEAVCQGCTAGHHVHGSISPAWYGANFCQGALAIPNRAALFGAVNVGDVLILPAGMPMHSMVVVQTSTGCFGGSYVYVRGFNNVGTLGTGQRLQYDNANRDIDRAAFWRPAPAQIPPVAGLEVFGNGGSPLSVVPYANYMAQATVIRNRCALAANGNWTFV